MRRGILILAAYLATIVLANWTLQRYGIVPVGFGLMAPAGVLWVGLSFTLRDLAQDRLGTRAIIAAILAGAALSYFVAPAFALASGLAFLFSEFCDFAVYSPLRRRHWLGAVALSNTVGLVLDSLVFLLLAFNSLAFLPGQVVGKFYMTAFAVIVLWVVRGRRDLSLRRRAA